MKSLIRIALLPVLVACAIAVVLTARGGAATLVESIERPAVIGPGLIYKHGDDPAWASPGTDTSDWNPVATSNESFQTSYGAYGPYTWFRADLELPAPAFDGLALQLPPFSHGSYEVYANGSLIGSHGNPPPNFQVRWPQYRFFPIPGSALSGSGQLTIAIRYWHDPGAPTHSPHLRLDMVQIGLSSTLDAQTALFTERALRSDVRFVALALLFAAVGFYHLLLYFKRRELKEYLWFGLTSLGFAANTYFVSAWSYLAIDDAHLANAATNVSIAWILITGIEFLWCFLGLRVGRFLRMLQWAQAGIALLSLVTSSSPTIFLANTLGQLQLLFASAVTIPAAFVVIREAWRGHPEARTLLIGIVAMTGCQVASVISSYAGLGIPPIAHYGFALFILSLSVALANRFSRVHADLDRLNRDLEGEVEHRTKELLQARDELSRQSVELRKTNEQLGDLVDQLKDSEQAALQASRAKSTFLANMSHELRTPLNAVLGFVQLMERDAGRSAIDRERFAIITRSGEHLLSLINDVLSISKIEAGQSTLNDVVFDLSNFLLGIEEMFQLRSRDKGLTFTVDVSGDLPRYVRGDAGKLRQICINLLGNAFKFTERGGVAFRMRWEAGHARFEVEDTGPGIRAEELPNLFEAFAQTQTGRAAKEGTGLGLAISRSFVQLMGGDITVQSTFGHGSTFRFDVTLPATEPADARPEPARVIGLERDQPRFRILVVDDKPENRLLLKDLLLLVGFDVREGANGEEAITVWRTWQPHLIFMDVRMPVLDGLEATQRIRRLEATVEIGRPRSVIVALSASVFEQDRKAVVSAGCDDFLAKPFRDDVLLHKIEERLGVRYRYEDAARVAASAGQPPAGASGAFEINLPSDLLARLNEAIDEGDVEIATEAISKVREHDERLAAELARLVKAYRFDDIQQLLARGTASGLG